MGMAWMGGRRGTAVFDNLLHSGHRYSPLSVSRIFCNGWNLSLMSSWTGQLALGGKWFYSNHIILDISYFAINQRFSSSIQLTTAQKHPGILVSPIAYGCGHRTFDDAFWDPTQKFHHWHCSYIPKKCCSFYFSIPQLELYKISNSNFTHISHNQLSSSSLLQ